MDFSKSLMHCSTIAYFMAPGKEKTPKQLWEDACNDLAKWQQKYDNMTDRLKAMANGVKAAMKIADLTAKVRELAVNKDLEPLSATAKSYLKKYYAYLKYGKWSASLDKGNRYTNKGKLGEPASIALISFLDDRILTKNETRFTNEFLSGEPDMIYDSGGLYLYDVKTSWDIETFMSNLGKDLNPLYWWQMQGYLALTGASQGEVSYCLVDTPDTVIQGERYALARRMGDDIGTTPEFLEAEKILINNMTFGDIPATERRIKFIVERDDEAIEKIYKRVALCREYMAEVQELHLQGVFAAKLMEIEAAPLEETQEIA